MIDIVNIDWVETGQNILRVSLAYVLALPLAFERGLRAESVGLRTFPIVAMAACGFGLIVMDAPGVSAESQSRFLQGLLAGIGFIGGGAIVKDGVNVRGLATAASIWNTGAIGVAVAFRREELAIILSAVNLLTLLVLRPRRDSPSDE